MRSTSRQHDPDTPHAVSLRAFERGQDVGEALRRWSRSSPAPMVRVARVVQMGPRVAPKPAEIPDLRSEPERWACAHHEAAHAVVAIAFGARPTLATIQPTPETGGHVAVDLRHLSPEAQTAVYTSGPFAESRFRRAPFHVDLESTDSRNVDRVCYAHGGRRGAVRSEGIILGCDLVNVHWSEIREVAAALMQHRTLNHSQIIAAIAA